LFNSKLNGRKLGFNTLLTGKICSLLSGAFLYVVTVLI